MKKPKKQEPVYKVKRQFLQYKELFYAFYNMGNIKENIYINSDFYVTDLSLLYAAVPPFFLALQLKLHEPES